MQTNSIKQKIPKLNKFFVENCGVLENINNKGSFYAMIKRSEF